MEILALLIGLFIFISLILPWCHLPKLNLLSEEIRHLTNEVRLLRNRLLFIEAKLGISQPAEAPRSLTEAQAGRPQPEVMKPEPLRPDPAPEAPLYLPQPQEYFSDPAPPRKNNFEQNIGAKLPVWIGSIALICAAFFLIKYSIESGWLGPKTRLMISSLFGASLIASGQWMFNRQHIPNAPRIAQGLVGSGLVILYGCLYASTNFYDFLPSIVAFAGMTVVTGLAVIMSLRHGQPIAAFGVLGGLLTPALIGSENPSALALFGYLFLLMAGMQIVLARREWWMMSVAATLGALIWAGLWAISADNADDRALTALFAVLLCVVMLAFTGQKVVRDDSAKMPDIHALNMTVFAGAALTLLLLYFKGGLSLFDWSLLGVLSLGLIGLAYLKPQVYQNALWGKVVASMVLLYVWAGTAALQPLLIVITLFFTLYIVLPALMMRRVPDPRFWVGIQVAAALLLYLTGYFQMNWSALHDSFVWGMLALVLAGISIHQAGEMRRHYQADEYIQNHLVALYSLAATSFISLGLAIELPFAYLPLAFSAQIAATLWIYHRSNIAFLRHIIVILTIIFAVLNYEQIYLFLMLAVQSLFNDPVSRTLAARLVLDAPLIKLGIPALFMTLGVWIHTRRNAEDIRLTHGLFGVAVMLYACTGYYLIRDLFHDDGNLFTQQAGFIERGSITMLLALSGIALLKASWRGNLNFLYYWGTGLFHLAMARIAFYDLLLLNPYFSATQNVGALPVINGVTLVYGVGAALALWAVYTSEWEKFAAPTRTIYKYFGFFLLFALASLSIRQYFHGAILAHGGMGDAEFYCYSFAWLVCGLALLGFGIWQKSRTARIGSLSFMLLTIAKVFLLDAGQLEGLYRVFSFLGLGLSLIGLSYFYTRFVFGQGPAKA